MKNNRLFLGRGWSFPPEFNIKRQSVEMLEGESDIISSLNILLSTCLGERVMLPNYGCNLDELLFESLNLTLETYIIDLIRTAILYHEPRIDAKKIEIDQTDEMNGVLLIRIDFVVRSTNSRMNMVYPFYKKEGSEV